MPRSLRIALFCALVCITFAAAASADDAAMRRIAYAVEDAALYHDSARRFVGLFLRIAGVAWIAVEWVAAVYLIRGFILLRRWFAEGAR